MKRDRFNRNNIYGYNTINKRKICEFINIVWILFIYILCGNVDEVLRILPLFPNVKDLLIKSYGSNNEHRSDREIYNILKLEGSTTTVLHVSHEE